MKQHELSIELSLFEKLQDRSYRKMFFLAEASARIAEQLIKLRKRRGLSQAELAEAAGTKQPAISRAERADYQNWSFNTLRGIADALDGRIRILIEPAEDILHEYDEPEVMSSNSSGWQKLTSPNWMTQGLQVGALDASRQVTNAQLMQTSRSVFSVVEPQFQQKELPKRKLGQNQSKQFAGSVIQ